MPAQIILKFKKVHVCLNQMQFKIINAKTKSLYKKIRVVAYSATETSLFIRGNYKLESLELKI